MGGCGGVYTYIHAYGKKSSYFKYGERRFVKSDNRFSRKFHNQRVGVSNCVALFSDCWVNQLKLLYED